MYSLDEFEGLEIAKISKEALYKTTVSQDTRKYHHCNASAVILGHHRSVSGAVANQMQLLPC